SQWSRSFATKLTARGVYCHVLGYLEKPGAKVAGLLELIKRTKGKKERLLRQVLGAVGVAGLKVEPGEDQSRRPAYELVEGSPVATLRALHQVYFRVCHWRLS